jgi:predicted neuraminidase
MQGALRSRIDRQPLLRLMLVLGFSAVASVGSGLAAVDYSKDLASPNDGRFRPSSVPGMEEAYLVPMFASAHAANLLLLKSGDLLCFWFSGTWEGQSDVAIVMSRMPKGATQWSKPQLIDHHAGESYQNPVAFQAPDGTLWLLHTTQGAGQGQANAKVLLAKSGDGGKSWSEPKVLFDSPGSFVRQPLRITPAGDWLLPMYVTPSRGITEGAETNYPIIKISRDRGTTWQDCAVPNANGYVQPGIVRLRNGRYAAFFRSRFADFIFRSDSPDGCSWTPPYKTVLPNNNSSIQVTQLKNGHLLMAFNNVGSVVTGGKPKAGPRKPLTVALSEDEGKTWGWVRDIETGSLKEGEAAISNQKDRPGREEFSYPSILQGPDGRIYVAYTYRRYVIKCVRFDEAWIKNGSSTGVFKGGTIRP